jgi:uncharacterized membrane protein
VWDGTTISDGTFEHDSERVYRSSDWSSTTNDVASDGSYSRSGTNVWFPFTGDSVSFQAYADTGFGEVQIFIDGTSQGVFNLYHTSDISRTFSFDGLGAGAHVIQVHAYRGRASVDAFITPGTAPFYTPPTRTGVVRYEEDDPALRYNGVPFAVTAQSWDTYNYAWSSDGYVSRSDTPGDTVSLTFDGTWVNLGFVTRENAGQVEVFIDGMSQGVVDTYSLEEDVTNVPFADLGAGTHTLSYTILATHNPLASSDYLVRLDYIDVWDGTTISDGTFDHDSERVYRSSDWEEEENVRAIGGSHIAEGSNIWFHFVGDTFTYIPITSANADSVVEVFVDGVSQGVITPTYQFSPGPVPYKYTSAISTVHLVQLKGKNKATFDGFIVGESTFVGTPMVEWFDTPTGGSTTTPAIGDINNDGIVEIVVTTQGGYLNVYRGDGADAGQGSPLLWSIELGSLTGGMVTGGLGNPAIAELDGNPGAEILVESEKGIYLFDHNGEQVWFNDTIKGNPFTAPSLANLDNDPDTEIVVSGGDGIYVLHVDGTVVRHYDVGGPGTPPVLADITGDGLLDILIAMEEKLYMFDYASASDEPVWIHDSPGGSVYGSPIVANVDANLSGGDSGPEIIMGWDGIIELLDADGSRIWEYSTNGGIYPSSISFADTDGDGEGEIIFYMKKDEGRLFVLNADGSLLWEKSARDGTNSSSGVSVLDLDGDGTWEIIWNGSGDGLTVFQGNDGTVLFNEPLINSRTIMDYPSLADVDGDDHVEIVTVDPEGIYIVGWDDVWATSRQVWNQYNYHITNINDDLTVPTIEPDSWLVHNTYRTQSPLKDAVPVYQVAVNHTLPDDGIVVQEATFSRQPNKPAPNLQWLYRQSSFEKALTTRFAATLPDMQPGEVRQVSSGTTVTYTLSSGSNHVTLPPLYVTAAHIISVNPSHQTGSAGGQATFNVLLSNPSPTDDTYTVSAMGLPDGWSSLPDAVFVPAGGEVTLPVTLTIPLNALATDYTFAFAATTGSGGNDYAPATLTVEPPHVTLEVTPELIETRYGETVTYTIALTNQQPSSDIYYPEGATYRLDVEGLPITLPALASDITVKSGQTISTTVSFTADASQGFYPFYASAKTTHENTKTMAIDYAALSIIGGPGVVGTLTPPVAASGPATPARFTLAITNTGSISDTYDLSVIVPNEWESTLQANGVSQSSLTLAAAVFNMGTLDLLVTPPTGTDNGYYPVQVVATSQTYPSTTAIISGQVEVRSGIVVEITPEHVTMQPNAPQVWDVTCTNTGSQADTFDLSVGGVIASNARLSQDLIALGAGEKKTVQLTTDGLPFALPSQNPFGVTAQSQIDTTISGDDTANVTIAGTKDVVVDVMPVSATVAVTAPMPLTYLTIITNTGNLNDSYQLTASTDDADWNATLETDEVYIPAHMAAALILTVAPAEQEAPTVNAYRVYLPLVQKPSSATSPSYQASVPASAVQDTGSINITVQARSTSSTVVDEDSTTIHMGGKQDTPPSWLIFLPIIQR